MRTLKYSDEKVEKMMSQPPQYLEEEMLEVRHELHALPRYGSICANLIERMNFSG